MTMAQATAPAATGPTSRVGKRKMPDVMPAATSTGPTRRDGKRRKPIVATATGASAPPKRQGRLATSSALAPTKSPRPKPAARVKKRSDGAYRDKYGEWHGPGGNEK